MCFCTDTTAYSKFDAGRILLKSREGEGAGRGLMQKRWERQSQNRVNSDKSQKKSNLGETYALNDHRQPAHESCSNFNSGSEAVTECLALLSFHLSSFAFLIPLSTVLSSDTWLPINLQQTRPAHTLPDIIPKICSLQPRRDDKYPHPCQTEVFPNRPFPSSPGLSVIKTSLSPHPLIWK